MRKICTKNIYNDLKSKIVSGKLIPGMRLPREIEFAKAYGISRNTLRPVLLELEKDRLIERIPSKGTFVAEQPPNKVITYLLPCPEFLTERFDFISQHSISVLSGVMRAAYDARARVETMPISSDNIYGHIDYNSLSRLNSGSLVFADSPWYWPLLPFLNKIGARVAMILNLEYLEKTASREKCKKFHMTVLDRRKETIDIYKQMTEKGCERIGLISAYLDEEHPLYIGFRHAARDNCRDEKLVLALSKKPLKNVNDCEKATATKKFIKEKRLDGIIIPYSLFTIVQSGNIYTPFDIFGSTRLGILDCPNTDLNLSLSCTIASFDERKVGLFVAKKLLADKWNSGIEVINAHLYEQSK
jgi:uncharacterized protein (UPF0297 family)